MKIQIKNYTFDASAKTISFDDYAEIDYDSILWIINATDSKALFNPINKFLSGSVTGNVLTVDYDTTFMNDTDELQIYYDKIPDPATETKQDDIINEIEKLVGFELPPYDSIEVNYTDDTKEIIDSVIYKDGVDTVATISATYPTTTKEIYTKT